MFPIPLDTVPNQTVSFNVDGAFWSVRIFQAITHMCADITRSSTPIITGVRCFGGFPLMPYEYMRAPNFGNLIFDAEPDWELFDGRCNLLYLDAGEWAEYKALLDAGTGA
ncbi:hypothetical protein [Burkholderia phage vB_BglM_WTB]